MAEYPLIWLINEWLDPLFDFTNKLKRVGVAPRNKDNLEKIKWASTTLVNFQMSNAPTLDQEACLEIC